VPPLTWETPVQFLKGVGPVRARALARLGIATAGDLLLHAPRGYLDRSRVVPIGGLVPGADVTVQGTVLTAGERRTAGRRTIQTVSVGDGTGVLFCVWFRSTWILKQLRSGTRVLVSGRCQRWQGRLQVVHPDLEILDREAETLHSGRLVPIYPLTAGIGQHWLRRLVHATLEQLAPALTETLPAALRDARGLLPRGEALRQLHFPDSVEAYAAARRRLVYEELFQLRLLLALRRRERQRGAGLRLGPPGDLTTRFVAALPFALTGAQRRVLAEILHDMRSGRAMHRLLQGDVGCGKTLVALIAALFVIEQGHQALLMAPTEVLARQHGETARRLCEAVGVRVETLTGGTPAADRRRLLADLAGGEIDLLVGTHAVLQDDVAFRSLGLAVVDEQHRFGVRQRTRAVQAGAQPVPPHLLVMSATPIPRSLAMTLYGDLALSLIDELPAGRRPVTTRIVPEHRLGEVDRYLAQQLERGRQAFVVVPVIEETESQDLRAAEAEFARLREGPLRGQRIGLLHGRLPAAEKQRIMTDFAAGELRLLVATTVVEVGIDVPGATVIVIHNPERFGLAQLHQLRGRVGRGERQAVCLLVVDQEVAAQSGQRLAMFARTHDGFRLAEEDLRLRGPGDLHGVRQHGAPGFRFANPLRDADLVQAAAADVQRILAADEQLLDPAHAVLRQGLDETAARWLVTGGVG